MPTIVCTRCQRPLYRTDKSTEMTAYAEQMFWPLGKVRALARRGDDYIALIECAHCGRENDVPIKF